MDFPVEYPPVEYYNDIGAIVALSNALVASLGKLTETTLSRCLSVNLRHIYLDIGHI